MNYAEYKSIGKFTRIDIAKQEGVLIGERFTELECIRLFRIADFYVEMGFDRTDTNDLFWINDSDKNEILEPYLDAIDISQLL